VGGKEGGIRMLEEEKIICRCFQVFSKKGKQKDGKSSFFKIIIRGRKNLSNNMRQRPLICSENERSYESYEGGTK